MNMILDRTDFEILTILQKEGRLSNKELAARIALAPSSCLARVRALMQANVLRGFHAEVAPEPLGIAVQAFVSIRLARTSRQGFRSMVAHAISLPEVVAVFNVSGTVDVLVHVLVRDVSHLRDLIVDSLATRREVERCETQIIYSIKRKPLLPCYTSPGKAAEPKPRRAAKTRTRARS
jgi:DNA-binding Lrp family transcriptional regulator